MAAWLSSGQARLLACLDDGLADCLRVWMSRFRANGHCPARMHGYLVPLRVACSLGCLAAWLADCLLACRLAVCPAWRSTSSAPPRRRRPVASTLQGQAEARRTANLRIRILDFRGIGSSRILILRGGILMSIGNVPEMLSQQILVGTILVYGRLAVLHSPRIGLSQRGPVQALEDRPALHDGQALPPCRQSLHNII